MKNKRFTLRYRRRRSGRTNYKSRLSLLKGRQTRLVVRKTNTATIVQFVEYHPDGDIIKAAASTQQLEKMGWKASTSNIPAAYAAGLLAGSLAKKAKISSAIVDLGLQQATHKGRLFAAVQGVIDAGISIPVSEEVLPGEDRVSGAHINDKMKAQVEAIKKKVTA